jgi:hypothetical protein
MMGSEPLLFDSARLWCRAFHAIAERQNCPLTARDVRAEVDVRQSARYGGGPLRLHRRFPRGVFALSLPGGVQLVMNAQRGGGLKRGGLHHGFPASN